MVADSETDEILALLRRRGRLPDLQASEHHGLVQDALRLASMDQLDTSLYPEWCDVFLQNGLRMSDSEGRARLDAWRQAELAALDSFDAVYP